MIRDGKASTPNECTVRAKSVSLIVGDHSCAVEGLANGVARPMIVESGRESLAAIVGFEPGERFQATKTPDIGV